eukprot:GHVS01066397.1.p3 GENE.GHVS01066397.1~~GHVS01066397.1.p3  ORF type:complete len:122 (-),score=26.36 GHVS01066397.1:66-431(-)
MAIEAQTALQIHPARYLHKEDITGYKLVDNNKEKEAAYLWLPPLLQKLEFTTIYSGCGWYQNKKKATHQQEKLPSGWCFFVSVVFLAPFAGEDGQTHSTSKREERGRGEDTQAQSLDAQHE